MLVPSGMRYFWRLVEASLRYQPETSTAAAVGLYNSIQSPVGWSVWVSASLITTEPGFTPGSTTPGPPPTTLLGRQFAFVLKAATGAAGLMLTSEKPAP